jgi:hypothetical protein
MKHSLGKDRLPAQIPLYCNCLEDKGTFAS